MIYDLQKASMWKRISAFLCDFDQNGQLERKICDETVLGIFPILFLDMSTQKNTLAATLQRELEGRF